MKSIENILIISISSRSGKIETLKQNLFLRLNSSNKMITLTQQTISSTLQLKTRRYSLQQQLLQQKKKQKPIKKNIKLEQGVKEDDTNTTFEVRFSVISVMGMMKKDCGDTKTSFDFDDWEEGNLALTDCF